MKFIDFLNEELISSGAVIETALDSVGLGIEIVRQTETVENTKLTPYKENGQIVKAVWVVENGPMKEEGYSIEDGNKKLNDLIKAFEDQGGKIIKIGSLHKGDESRIKFKDFDIILSAFTINSALDKKGFSRTYLKVISK